MNPNIQRFKEIRALISTTVENSINGVDQDPGVAAIAVAAKPLIENATTLHLHGTKGYLNQRPVHATLIIAEKVFSNRILMLRLHISRKGYDAYTDLLNILTEDIKLDSNGHPADFSGIKKGSSTNYAFSETSVQREYATSFWVHDYYVPGQRHRGTIIAAGATEKPFA